MKTYTVIRTTGSLRERIQKAIQQYQARRGCPPAEIVVNEREVEKAQAVIKKMGLKVHVATVGGCLFPEVWVRTDGEACQSTTKEVH